MLRIPLVSDEIYHLYNRGVDKRTIFLDDSYYSRFVSTLRHYLKYDYPYSLFLQRVRDGENIKGLALKMATYQWNEPPVEILSFCLMPNHFHLQVRQMVENGITTFMHRLGTGYTMYFNARNERTGSLFQGPFKSARVENEGQFLCLNRYIHINPIAAGLVIPKHLVYWQWSSLPEYLRERKGGVCQKDMVLSQFKSVKDYLGFVLADFEESDLQSLEGLTIDDDFGWFENLEERKRHAKEAFIESLKRG